MLEYVDNNSGGNGSGFNQSVVEHPNNVDLFKDYPPWLLCFAAGSFILFMFIGIPGNLITVVALFRTKKLRNATAVFIMNLSVSDLMFCCFNLPLATSTFWHGAWLHGALLCRLFPLLRYGLVAVSLFTVLAITINRYVMIGHPRLYSKIYKPKYLALMVAATWTLGFGAFTATWFGLWGQFGLDVKVGSCSILPDKYGRSPKTFYFILGFLTPCVAIVVCYARIFYIVRKTALNSRRKDITKEASKSTLEVRFIKNFDNSAMGSSCMATLTTLENGNSPSRHDKIGAVVTASPTGPNNFKSPPNCKYIPRCSARPDNPYRRSFKDLENGANSNRSLKSRNDRASPAVRSHGVTFGCVDRNSESYEDSERSQYDNCSDQDSKERDPSIVGNEDPGEPQRVGFRDDNGSSENYDSAANSSDVQEFQLANNEDIPFIDSSVPQQNNEAGPLSRIAEQGAGSVEAKPQIRFETVDAGAAQNKQILNLESLGSFGSSRRPLRFEENSLQVPKQYQAVENSSENLLTPQTIRYDEISEDFASSRSDSPSERRFGKKTNVLQRESRFKSCRTRHFETGKMTQKDKKLLKMILVIFTSFLICYLPITVTKTFGGALDWRGLNIASYILIYLTTCINPVIYVVMSSEYRSAYKNFLLCRSDSQSGRHDGLRDRRRLNK